MGAGAGATIMYYEEKWVRHIHEICKCMSPDGSPAELFESLRISMEYYPTGTGTTSVWYDYIIESKDE